MRVRDMEFQIPVPKLPNSDKPDFTVIQKAWWDVINIVYDVAEKDTPMRLTLELRIMGGSSLHMAPQAGNNITASIEVLTIPDADRHGEWANFMQRVSDKWMQYKDNNNVLLNTRPHWAKDWTGIALGPEKEKLPIQEYLRTISYRDAIVEFKKTLGEIGEVQGWGLDDIRARFSNELWDKMLFS